MNASNAPTVTAAPASRPAWFQVWVPLLLGGLTACVVAAASRPAVPAPVQAAHQQIERAFIERARLDQALTAYEEGRMTDAARGFLGLAREGHVMGAYNFAMMHLRKELPRSDPKTAVRWLRAAASQGMPRAYFALGLAHELGAGTGHAPSETQAYPYYLKAAELGQVEAQVAVGTSLLLGRGVARDMPRAAHWLGTAARQGDPASQFMLGMMYEHGQGLSRDLHLARYWYEQAAENGDETAGEKARALSASLDPH